MTGPSFPVSEGDDEIFKKLGEGGGGRGGPKISRRDQLLC